MRIPTLLGAIALAVALPVFAQTPAPASEVPTADAPKHNCTKPGDFPGNLASENQKRQFQKDYTAYTDCLKTFAGEQRLLAEPHMKASNATVDEYNAAVKSYNDEVEKRNKANK